MRAPGVSRRRAGAWGNAPRPARPGIGVGPAEQRVAAPLAHDRAVAERNASQHRPQPLPRHRRRGVGVPVWRVLASLSGSRGETVTGLAEVCLLQQPTMTKLLDRMVRDGLVTRAQDARPAAGAR